jgi:hypothetical protein
MAEEPKSSAPPPAEEFAPGETPETDETASEGDLDQLMKSEIEREVAAVLDDDVAAAGAVAEAAETPPLEEALPPGDELDGEGTSDDDIEKILMEEVGQLAEEAGIEPPPEVDEEEAAAIDAEMDDVERRREEADTAGEGAEVPADELPEPEAEVAEEPGGDEPPAEPVTDEPVEEPVATEETPEPVAAATGESSEAETVESPEVEAEPAVASAVAEEVAKTTAASKGATDAMAEALAERNELPGDDEAGKESAVADDERAALREENSAAGDEAEGGPAAGGGMLQKVLTLLAAIVHLPWHGIIWLLNVIDKPFASVRPETRDLLGKIAICTLLLSTAIFIGALLL